MLYSTKILEYFNNTLHVGKLDEHDPNVMIAEVGSVQQGNILCLYLKKENETIIAAKFLAQASVPATACCEYVCEFLEGKTMQAARQLTVQHFLAALDMSAVQTHDALLVERLVKKVVRVE